MGALRKTCGNAIPQGRARLFLCEIRKDSSLIFAVLRAFINFAHKNGRGNYES